MRGGDVVTDDQREGDDATPASDYGNKSVVHVVVQVPWHLSGCRKTTKNESLVAEIGNKKALSVFRVLGRARRTQDQERKTKEKADRNVRTLSITKVWCVCSYIKIYFIPYQKLFI